MDIRGDPVALLHLGSMLSLPLEISSYTTFVFNNNFSHNVTSELNFR